MPEVGRLQGPPGQDQAPGRPGLDVAHRQVRRRQGPGRARDHRRGRRAASGRSRAPSAPSRPTPCSWRSASIPWPSSHDQARRFGIETYCRRRRSRDRRGVGRDLLGQDRGPGDSPVPGQAGGRPGAVAAALGDPQEQAGPDPRAASGARGSLRSLPGHQVRRRRSPAIPCVHVCPKQMIEMKGDPVFGIPQVVKDECTGCTMCVAACPGLAITPGRPAGWWARWPGDRSLRTA